MFALHQDSLLGWTDGYGGRPVHVRTCIPLTVFATHVGAFTSFTNG